MPSLVQSAQVLLQTQAPPRDLPLLPRDPALLVGRTYISYFGVLNARWPHPDATALLAELRPLSADHSAPALTFTHGDPPGDTESTPRGR